MCQSDDNCGNLWLTSLYRPFPKLCWTLSERMPRLNRHTTESGKLMTRQMDERARILNEMIDRLGTEDPLIAQWTNEHDVLASFEFRYPNKLQSARRDGTRIASGWAYGNRFSPSTRSLRNGSRGSTTGYH